MADLLTEKQRSERMSRIRSKNTRPELIVRKIIFRLGYRYRLHDAKLSGKPDLVFKGRKKVIFVNGCFWHHHPDPQCRIAHVPKSNSDFWTEKLARNRSRDLRNIANLREAGWSTLVLWECDLADVKSVEQKLRDFLERQSD